MERHLRRLPVPAPAPAPALAAPLLLFLLLLALLSPCAASALASASSSSPSLASASADASRHRASPIPARPARVSILGDVTVSPMPAEAQGRGRSLGSPDQRLHRHRTSVSGTPGSERSPLKEQVSKKEQRDQRVLRLQSTRPGQYWGDGFMKVLDSNLHRRSNSAPLTASQNNQLRRFIAQRNSTVAMGSGKKRGRAFEPPSLAQVLGMESGSESESEGDSWQPQAARGPKRKEPQMKFNGFNQKFQSAFQFAWWCNDTWRCWINPDGSVTVSTFWKDTTSGWNSKFNFYYGVFSVEMKLPKTNSEGMWHTFYVIQPQNWPNNDSRHAEIDVEFYGSRNPRNIKIATNIISNGYQNLEQHDLPFDPSQEFHRYTILWSQQQIVFFVDNTPIRIVKREKGKPWPARPVQLLGTTWQNSHKVDWSDGPTSVQYRRWQFWSCAMWSPNRPLPACSKLVSWPQYPWNKPLTKIQLQRMKAYRKKYLINSWGWDKWK